MDIVFGVGLLVFTLPVTLPAAFALKLSHRGPLFAYEERAALNGKTFKAIRFRCHANGDEPSVVNTVMIKTRVDEIPQLVHVIKGEMSFFDHHAARPFMA